MHTKMGSHHLLKLLVVLTFALASGLSARMVFAARPAAQSGGSSGNNAAPNLAGTVPQQVRDGSARLVGKHTASDDIVVLFMAPFKDQAGLEAFLADVTNPNSPNYQPLPHPRRGERPV